jgi:hypothetical protein
MPGIADKFTQSAQGRLLWPGMTSFAGKPYSIGCIFGQAFRMRSETLMVRSAATPRVSNHVAVGCAAITLYFRVHPDEER